MQIKRKGKYRSVSDFVLQMATDHETLGQIKMRYWAVVTKKVSVSIVGLSNFVDLIVFNHHWNSLLADPSLTLVVRNQGNAYLIGLADRMAVGA